MKLFYLNITLFFCTTVVQGQNSVSQTHASTSLSENRWRLDEYVWSHVHSKAGLKDKPVLDFDAIDNWVELSPRVLSISFDGNYFVYGIQNKIMNRLDTVVVRSTTGNWRSLLPPDAKAGFFTIDSRLYIFPYKTGLFFLKTGTDHRKYEKDVKDFKKEPNRVWLAYRLANPDSTLVLANLVAENEKRINSVESYFFDSKGEWIIYSLMDKRVILRNLASEKEVVLANLFDYNFHSSQKWLVGRTQSVAGELILFNIQTFKEQRFSKVISHQLNETGNSMLLQTDKRLEYMNLMEGKSTVILSDSNAGLGISNAVFDKTGSQVVFVTGSGVNKVIWYWKVGMKRAEQKVHSQIPGIENRMVIQDGINFSENGQFIRFIIKPQMAVPSKPAPGAIQLDVWSFQDKMLQSSQSNRKEITDRTGLLDLETGMVHFPEREFEKLTRIGGNYALIRKSGKDKYGDRFWEKGYYEDSVWVLSIKTGIRKLLPIRKFDHITWFSPVSGHLVYFNATKGCHFFSLEPSTGKLVDISSGVPDWVLGLQKPFLRTSETPTDCSTIKLWVEENKRFLVCDNNGDLWQLDISGKSQAICVTNEYGKLRNISFNVLEFHGGDSLLLGAFNRKTKMQGFYRKVLGKNDALDLLSMDSCYMDGIMLGGTILKAYNAKVWVLSRQTATLAPNYFVTLDFKSFTQLTFLMPQKKYNWLTAELHSFKQLDGTTSQGVLYKPENFDPAKKYPLIISFYGNLSDQLYKFPAANYIVCPSIYDEPAWMVSHGYLVFIPDIYFIKSQWGPSTVNTIDGAARYLGQLPYVNGKLLGAAGHSNSGRFGYYLLTHSKSFAAMSVGSGFTGGDVLSGALSLRSEKDSRGSGSCLEVAELKAYGTALGNIWQNKSRWIDHIAPLQADKASSPFLLFHNKKDGDDVRLAVELFLAFRRLEKKCWWLQYDNGDHIVKGDDARDWTIRYTQFFDHYLKKAPAPRWMTQGIPTAMKGIETGYELDPKGNCAMEGKDPCNICHKWNE